MKIYVAGRWTERPRCRAVRAALVNHGYQVTSRWLYDPPGNSFRVAAERDLQDLRQSDLLILVEPTPLPYESWVRMKPEYRGISGGGGGRYIEVGFMLARNCPIFVWDQHAPTDGSDGRAIFWTLPQVTVFETLPALITALAAVAFRRSEGPIA